MDEVQLTLAKLLNVLVDLLVILVIFKLGLGTDGKYLGALYLFLACGWLLGCYRGMVELLSCIP